MERCEVSNLRPTHDGLGYFGFNDSAKAYIEVMSFDRLVNAATERNRAFLRQAGPAVGLNLGQIPILGSAEHTELVGLPITCRAHAGLPARCGRLVHTCLHDGSDSWRPRRRRCGDRERPRGRDHDPAPGPR